MVHTVLYAVCCPWYMMLSSCSICHLNVKQQLCTSDIIKQHFDLYFSTFNWVLGNTVPMDYFPPFFCGKSQLEETETPDTVFTALASLAMKSKKEE